MLEKVIKLTTSGGGIELKVDSRLVSYTSLLFLLGEYLWEWFGEFVRMLLYAQDYENLLVALGIKRFNSPSVKLWLQSKRFRFESRKENTQEHSFDVW